MKHRVDLELGQHRRLGNHIEQVKKLFLDRVELLFDAGHRILDYPGNCGVPHGHTYKAEIMLSSQALDDMGFVLDFTGLKAGVGKWVNEHWDHGFLLNVRDQELLTALKSLKRSKIFLFNNENPTAEVIAKHLFGVVSQQYGSLVSRVRIWESPNQYAEYFKASD